MQKYSNIVLTLLTIICLVGCDKSHQNIDQKAIQNATQEYQEAYNQQNAAKLSTLWASDAIYINPVTGESAQGRDAIEKLFTKKFTDGKKRNLEILIKNIEFPSADEAIENGIMKLTLPNQLVEQAAFQVSYIKENNKWLLKAINEIELQKTPSNYEQLKDLAWLIGKWEDSDDNIQILFDNQWDKYKNFITQHFKMKIYEQDNIEGKQIIAWDPVKKLIRSWVFDSDGGFGEGTWEKVDKSWYANMQYTLSDGSAASSKNIYTPINDHSYTFASVEREVDGEILPDMNPVTVEKSE